MNSDESTTVADESTPIKENPGTDRSKDEDKLLQLGKQKWRIKPVPKRYILAIMILLGTGNLFALRVNMSVAVVAMVKNYTIYANGTENTAADFDWSPGEQGILLAAFFWGYIITPILGGYLSTHFGGKLLFGGGVLSSAVLTLLTSPAAQLGGLHLLIALRVFLGLCEGVTYPCIGTLLSKWAPALERSRLVAIAYTGSYVGVAIAMPLCGIIAQCLGWAWIFYFFGLLALVWCGFWCWIVAESPCNHATITSEELQYITQSLNSSGVQNSATGIPWKDLLKSLPMWAIPVAHFVENWGFFTLLTELPTFLNDIMKFDLSKAGGLASLPYIVMSIAIPAGGCLADLFITWKWLTTTCVRKLLNCVAFAGQAIFLTAAAYSMTPAAAIPCLIFAVGVGGLSWAGFAANALDIAPQFAGIINGISITVATVPGIVAPTLTGYLTMNRTVEEWRSVFYIAAGFYILGIFFYGIFASGDLQPWAEDRASKERDTDFAMTSPTDVTKSH